MRNVVFGAFALVVLLALTKSLAGSYGQSATQPAQGPTMVTRSVGDATDQVTILDPDTRTLCVYHVETTTGKITLRSVRKLHWDLQMNAFNTSDPQPLDIRAMLDAR